MLRTFQTHSSQRPTEAQATSGVNSVSRGRFRSGAAPLRNNDLIVGAVGALQFEVVVYRLRDEYKVEAIYEPTNLQVARWIESDSESKLEEFRKKAMNNIALDAGGYLTCLAPTRVNLNLTEERYPEIRFLSTREHW